MKYNIEIKNNIHHIFYYKNKGRKNLLKTFVHSQ